MFSAHLVRLILDNPVYCGKIAFGRRSNEKIKGTRNDYHIVKQDEYLVSDGKHEAIIDEELWEQARKKRIAQAKKYEHVNKGNNRIHLLSGILKCPICGAGMYGNKSIKHRNGVHYKDYYFYGCKHRTLTRGHKCTYRKQLSEEKLDSAVAEVISKMVSNSKFASVMQSKINMKVDTREIDTEIENYAKQLTKYIGTKKSLANQIDSLDVLDKHYDRKINDLQERLDKMYDYISDIESILEDAKTRKQAIESEKLTGDNIYKLLIHFDKMYDTMDEEDKRALLVAMIKEINVYEDEQLNGQWLKSIKFNLPLLEEQWELGLDNDSHVETVVLLSKGAKGPVDLCSARTEVERRLVDSRKVKVDFSLEDMDLSEFKGKATYEQIKAYVLEQTGLKVSSLYIAQIKKKCGLDVGENFNLPKSENARQPQCTPEKEEAIMQAFKHFGIV